MKKYSIKAKLPKEDENQIIRKLNEIEELLPFLTGLSPKERMSIPKMGKGSRDFVDRTLRYAQEHEYIQPKFYNLEHHRNIIELLNQMKRIMSVFEPLCEKIKDTYILLGADAFQDSRTFYREVKNASKAGVNGIETIVEDLAERFKRTSSKSSTIPNGAPKIPSITGKIPINE